MRLLQKSRDQARIWKAYLQLNSGDNTERLLAMQTLEKAAPASLPCLHFAVGPNASLLTKLSAAVVLHRLGEKQGMGLLLDTLVWRIHQEPDIAEELENAFLQIGSPDAAAALLEAWAKTTNWYPQNPVIQFICRVWARLRDPNVLPALVARAAVIPELFVDTVVPFGELAIPHLEGMTCGPEPALRALAVAALQRTPGARSFAVLVPLLKDADPQVRALVPAALVATGGQTSAVRAIIYALEQGYSTEAAIQMLGASGPVPYPALRDMAASWNPSASAPPYHTEGAVRAALRLLENRPRVHFALVPTLCAFLQRNPTPALTAEAARVLGRLAPQEREHGETAKNVLMPLLTSADADVRKAAAESLVCLQERVGRELAHLLEDCRPHGSLYAKFQTMLLGGPEAGQAVNQAVQQVQQWVSRLSKETAERFGGTGLPVSPSQPYDARLSGLLRDLLASTLDALNYATQPAAIEELVTLAIAALRAVPRLGLPEALAAHDSLVRAFHTVKFGSLEERSGSGPFQPGTVREVGQIIRREAGESLLQIYREDSFPLLLEALYHPVLDVKSTAIAALGRLGDARALPHFAPYLADASHVLYARAQEASNAIRRINPEMMILLRASSHVGDARPDTLLRPASGNNLATPADQLLRPSQPE